MVKVRLEVESIIVVSPLRVVSQTIIKILLIALIIGHLNINYLRNKLEMLREIVQDKSDVLLVSETKVDLSSPSSQFAIKGFSVSFWLDRNNSRGGIMLFVREEIPSKLLIQYEPNRSVENIFIEINLWSKKWLLSCSHNNNLTF